MASINDCLLPNDRLRLTITKCYLLRCVVILLSYFARHEISILVYRYHVGSKSAVVVGEKKKLLVIQKLDLCEEEGVEDLNIGLRKLSKFWQEFFSLETIDRKFQ